MSMLSAPQPFRNDRCQRRSLVRFLAGTPVMIHGPRAVSRTYWREIAVILSAKAVALALLYLLFFAAPAPVPALGDHIFHQGSRK
jgi:hypothetical protein